MIEYSSDASSDRNGYQRIVVILMFLAGVLNSSVYLNFIGFHNLNKGILLIFNSLLAFMCFIVILNILFKKKGQLSCSFGYLITLAIAVILKYIVLFIQFPTSFLPNGIYFGEVLTILSNLVIVIILIRSIHSIFYIRAVIWAFGIGVSISVIIPFLFFPEMIGSRVSIVNGFEFTGAFWNSAVISYMSVAWLLIALSVKEDSKLKRILLLGMFVLIILGALAGLSRATLLSLIFSTVVYLIASKKFKQYIKVMIGLIGLLFVLFFYFPDVVDNFEQRLDGGIDIEEEARTRIWKEYLVNIPDYFLLGEISGNYKKYSLTGHGPHSVFLNWITQFGVLSLVGFIVLLIYVLKSIKIIKKKESNQVSAGLYAWLAAYLSIAVINETGFKELTVFGGIGIILAWGNVVKKRELK